MTQNVEVILTAQEAQAVRAWLNLKNSIGAYDSQLGKVDGTQRKVAGSAKQQDTAFAGISSRMTSILGGYVSITAAAQLYLQASKDAIAAAEEAAKKQDEMTRRFRGQAGLSGLQGEAARESIYDVAEKTSATSEQAFGGAAALASTGFEATEAQGPALKAMLELIQAQQLKGKNVDAGQLAESASKYLASQGKEKTGENLKELAVAIQGLKETPLKITDLEQLAKQGATLKGKIGYKEQIANFAMLLESMDAEKAGTSLREVSLHLATAGGAKDKTKALKQIGLKPEDVDLVGESFQEALAKVEKGLQSVPESKRAAIKKTLFEAANIAGYELLAQNQEKVNRYVAQEGDVEGFEKDVTIGSSGRNAAERRQSVRLERQKAKQDQKTDLYRNALEEMERERGTSEFQIAIRKKGFDLMTNLGVSPDTAMQMATGEVGGEGGGGKNATAAQKIRDQLVKDLGQDQIGTKEDFKRMVDAMEKMANGKGVTVNMPGGAAPARPVAAAGIGGASP